MEEKGQGWLVFAAVVLGVAGIMRVFDAIWAFRYHGALPQNFEDAIFGHSLKTYGWVYLVVAIVLILCAFGVMARSQFSRWIGIFAGAVMAISAIWWMPFYPVWSLTYILVGVLVIYGLSTYGGREVTAWSRTTHCPKAELNVAPGVRRHVLPPHERAYDLPYAPVVSEQLRVKRHESVPAAWDSQTLISALPVGQSVASCAPNSLGSK